MAMKQIKSMELRLEYDEIEKVYKMDDVPFLCTAFVEALIGTIVPDLYLTVFDHDACPDCIYVSRITIAESHQLAMSECKAYFVEGRGVFERKLNSVGTSWDFDIGGEPHRHKFAIVTDVHKYMDQWYDEAYKYLGHTEPPSGYYVVFSM